MLSNYKDDDITPELAKLDEMMNSIQREMDADSSLAANVVTAFLKKEHTLVQQNAGGYPSIIQVWLHSITLLTAEYVDTGHLKMRTPAHDPR